MLRFTYEIEGSPIEHVREAPEGDNVSEPETILMSASSHVEVAAKAGEHNEGDISLEIVQATYGAGDCQLDVTERLQRLVKNGNLSLVVENAHFTDPCPNMVKSLRVAYQLHGSARIHFQEVPEHDVFIAPLRGGDRVGIFYTNNPGSPKYLDRVLQQLKRAAGNVDVLTCPWHPIASNPFPELSWPYHVGGHSTMYLQILKLLYTAQAIGQYKYVFFLEHDVLYPEGYFDIEPFSEDVLENTNYIGLCEEGFQPKHADLKPLYQLAMSIPAAIEHFTASLRGSFIGNHVANEPVGRTRKTRSSSEPAVHINYGTHFTSYYTTFSKKVVEESHPYWGAAADWWIE
jgi:hypothetical protein